ncbi:long chain acyl-CoA synthetase [Acrasis kona]|uniref:Long chain acyl-CoA synthetase n=1 Tax=Acrasis kona TaxID=1008807 RepID=A0AAW2YNT3_9EUKA
MFLLTIIGYLVSSTISLLDYATYIVQKSIKSKSYFIHDLRGKFDSYPELSNEVSDPNRGSDETNPRRNALSTDVLLSLPDELEPKFENVRTMDQLFERSVQINKNKPCLQYRPVINVHKGGEFDIPEFGPLHTETYNETFVRVKNLSAGIVELTKLNSTDMLGIFEDTRKEWFLTLQACFRYNIVVTTVYASLGDDALITAINETQVTCMLINEKALGKFIKVIQPKCPSLKYLIYCTNFHKDESETLKINNDVAALSRAGVKAISFNEVEELGRSLKEAPAVKSKSEPDSVALIMYTSGTTGEPKGVVILHRNIVASTTGLNEGIGNDPNVVIVYIAYLPMAHILELVAEHAMFIRGGAIAYGTPRTLTERGAKPIGDIAAIRPGVMVGVPRVFDTVKKGALERIKAGSPIVKWLFDAAFQARRSALLQGRETPLWNYLVFNKFRSLMGGRMSLMISGGAPLSKESQEFMRVCFGCSVVQGYGLTETCASSCIQNGYHSFSTRSVGPPVPCCEIKLLSAPELNYTVHDKPYPRGEVLVRGTNVSAGYYKRPEITKDVFTSDGWFKTGDIAQINPDGTFTLIDRRKNLIKLAHGEYIALERLESVYGNSPFVMPSGVAVFADSYQNFPVAVVLPQMTYVKSLKEYADMTNEQIIANEGLRKTILEDLKRVGREGGLKKFEFIQDVALAGDLWTPENGMLTAAMKLKRDQLLQKYSSQINKMYKKK